MSLSDLGNRICILGPSNNGKSTLDVLHHVPNTDWEPQCFRDWDLAR